MREIDELICAYLDGRLTAATADRFCELVRTDDAFVTRLTEMSLLTFQLSDDQTIVPSEDDRVEMPMAIDDAGRFRRWPQFASLAAALLIGAAAIAINFGAMGETAVAPDAPDHGGPIATLIESSGVVSVDGARGYEGHELPAGSYTIESGSAEFLLRNRVTMHIADKTQVRMPSPSLVKLDYGKAHFNVPHEVSGFTVHLPGDAKVVDLGTSFSVHVDDESGEALVRVWEGSVRLYRNAEDAGSVLTTGVVAHITRDGVELRQLEVMGDGETASASDDFAYSIGDVLAGYGWPGRGFTGAWRGDSAFEVVAIETNNTAIETRRAGDHVFIGRPLATPIDFDRDGVHYLSFLVRDEDVDTKDEYFWVGLQSSDAADATWDVCAAFGLSSSETAMIATRSTLTGYRSGPPVAAGRWHRFVCRIETRDDAPDEVALLVLDPAAAPPDGDSIDWTMTRSTMITGVADELHIQAGALTQTRFDDIRIGATLKSVFPPRSPDSSRPDHRTPPPTRKEILK